MSGQITSALETAATDRHRLQRSYVVRLVGAAILVIGPIVGMFFAGYLAIVDGVSGVGLIVLAIMYPLEMLGVTVGAHRYFSHRAFSASTPVKIVLAVLACMANGSVLSWAANHRHHHRFSDKQKDLHSPHKFEGQSIFTTKGQSTGNDRRQAGRYETWRRPDVGGEQSFK